VALGVGAHVAVEAADVALVRSELSDCVTFLALSKATFRTILLNFFWAFCFNFLCLPVAAALFYPAVYIPPLVAGMGMACSSLFVVCSSLMLRRFSPPVPRADELVDGAKRPISLKAQMIGSGKSCKYQKFRC
jgi:Cu+-exporting ATPase